MAVLRLITSSNFTGCSIGKSAGFAPLKPFARLAPPDARPRKLGSARRSTKHHWPRIPARSNHGEPMLLAMLGDFGGDKAGQPRRDDEQAVGVHSPRAAPPRDRRPVGFTRCRGSRLPRARHVSLRRRSAADQISPQHALGATSLEEFHPLGHHFIREMLLIPVKFLLGRARDTANCRTHRAIANATDEWVCPPLLASNSGLIASPPTARAFARTVRRSNRAS